jgi:hypothetical protein
MTWLSVMLVTGVPVHLLPRSYGYLITGVTVFLIYGFSVSPLHGLPRHPLLLCSVYPVS